MSATHARRDHFITRWRGALETKAQVVLEVHDRSGFDGAPTKVADGLAAACGYQTIGFDWELLDPLGDMSAPRSARGAFADALHKDLVMKTDWLGADAAAQCAEDFITAFDPTHLTILTNHIVRGGGKSEGWFPISSATFEWAFVGYDDAAAALLLLTAED